MVRSRKPYCHADLSPDINKNTKNTHFSPSFFHNHCLKLLCSPYRCPYKDDRYLTTLVPVDSSSGLDFPTHYRRFIFQMFTFVDSSSAAPLKENVVNTSTDKKFLQKKNKKHFVFLCQHCFSCSGVHSLQYNCVHSWTRNHM